MAAVTASPPTAESGEQGAAENGNEERGTDRGSDSDDPGADGQPPRTFRVPRAQSARDSG